MRVHFWQWLAAFGCLTIVATPVFARSGKVALTFDDLPGLTISSDQAYVDQFNQRLVLGLKRHRFPAIGFVNAGKLEDLQRDHQTANLERWLDAGMMLGNHTFSHDSPNAVGTEAYLADIARDEPLLQTLLGAKGQTLRWFRHPYLETGYPAATKRAIDSWLATHGYRIAPVTIDADDWEFAEPYDDAVARHDRPMERRIMRAYLAHTAIRIDWSLRSARVLFGRDIAQVMLLHCSRLNADALDKLAALLRRMRLRPVGLGEAMRDPAYETADRYVGRDGLSWLERWAVTLHRQLPEAGDIDPPHWIELAYDRVDNDRQRANAYPPQPAIRNLSR